MHNQPFKAFLLILSFLIISCTQNGETEKTSDMEKIIAAYVFPGQRVMEQDEIRADLLTHVIFAFANIEEGQLVSGHLSDEANFAVLRSVREQHSHLRLLIAVGGWTWSGNFSDMALTPESRKIFIDSAVDYVREHDLDGLDLDWEYPGLPGDNNIHRPEDKENFTALLRECRSALDSLSEITGKYYELTIAAGAFEAYLQHTEMDIVAGYLDFVNLMTYDFTGEWAATTGHHANLHTPDSDPAALSGHKSVQMFMDAGVPAKKLVLGVAFYGRGWGSVLPENNGLYQPGTGLQGVSLRYHNIVDDYLDHPDYALHWDESASAPFLWNAADSIFITFENAQSVKAKASYALEHNLGGVMFWQYHADHENELLKALQGVRQ